jgi:hypothetical protein
MPKRRRTFMRWLVVLGATFFTAMSPTVYAAEGNVSVEHGLQVSITHGCHDTAGYAESDGKLDPSAALKGSAIGWRGPWGTTYALNLRLTVAEKARTEDEFVKFARTLKTRPPMPWFNVNAMEENDLRSLFRYIKSLGEPGKQAPEAVGPDEEPKTPYYLLQPTPPKG